jgi:hypothetical protein
MHLLFGFSSGSILGGSTAARGVAVVREFQVLAAKSSRAPAGQFAGSHPAQPIAVGLVPGCLIDRCAAASVAGHHQQHSMLSYAAVSATCGTCHMLPPCYTLLPLLQLQGCRARYPTVWARFRSCGAQQHRSSSNGSQKQLQLQHLLSG